MYFIKSTWQSNYHTFWVGKAIKDFLVTPLFNSRVDIDLKRCNVFIDVKKIYIFHKLNSFH